MVPVLILAEAASVLPDPGAPTSIGWILAGVGGLFLILNQGADFIGRFRKREARETELVGQPLEVRAAADYVQRHEHAALAAEVKALRDGIREEIRASVERLDDKRTTSIGNVHAKIETAINNLRTEVSASVRELREDQKSTAEAMQDRITKVTEAVASVAGQVTQISERLDHA